MQTPVNVLVRATVLSQRVLTEKDSKLTTFQFSTDDTVGSVRERIARMLDAEDCELKAIDLVSGGDGPRVPILGDKTRLGDIDRRKIVAEAVIDARPQAADRKRRRELSPSRSSVPGPEPGERGSEEPPPLKRVRVQKQSPGVLYAECARSGARKRIIATHDSFAFLPTATPGIITVVKAVSLLADNSTEYICLGNIHVDGFDKRRSALRFEVVDAEKNQFLVIHRRSGGIAGVTDFVTLAEVPHVVWGPLYLKLRIVKGDESTNDAD